VLAWPIRDALVLHLSRLRQLAIEQFRHSQLLYVMGAGDKHPPTLPPLLMNIEEE
jgi:hypothetical protein